MNALHWSTQVLEVIVALLLAPLFVGWINQCRAWLQNRSAPSVLQPYRGIRKLFHKDAVVASNASPLFRVAPYVVFGTMACAAAIIPSLGTRLPFSNAADAIALVGLFATARVFMSLAAMDVGTAFGSLGARREMLVGFLAEPALLMVIFLASLISVSTALPAISENGGACVLPRACPGATTWQAAHQRFAIASPCSASAAPAAVAASVALAATMRKMSAARVRVMVDVRRSDRHRLCALPGPASP